MKKVFIIDDNDTNLTVIAAMLEDEFKVFTMVSVAKMFTMLDKIKPDVMLIDIEMPQIDGLTAISMLKENNEFKSIPIIVLTGWVTDEITAHAMQLGASSVIGKPTTSHIVKDAIEKALA